MRVCVLGPTRVFDGDGRELDLGARKHRELLALLAAAGGRPVAAGVLADRLWRGQPPPTAAGTLQGYVARLRRTVEPDRGRLQPARLLVTRGDGYALELPPGALDAARFAELAGAARAAVQRGDARGAVSAARSALELWAGAAYDDIADVDVVEPESARLAELRTGVTEDLAAARLELGEHTEAGRGLLVTRARRDQRSAHGRAGQRHRLERGAFPADDLDRRDARRRLDALRGHDVHHRHHRARRRPGLDAAALGDLARRHGARRVQRGPLLRSPSRRRS